MKETYKSRVYTDRPAYADFDAPHKFSAIQSIVARRLVEHPDAICSYSGGADSDIMIDVKDKSVWVRGGGPGSCLWASEIEEFPIAVTKARFGGGVKNYNTELE